LPEDRKIAVICASGYRSSVASRMLQARGYKDVENVAGGMTAFTESK
jgi:hydroxyacylglutathione hydrolase